MGEVVDGGSVINVAYPSSFLRGSVSTWDDLLSFYVTPNDWLNAFFNV